MHRFRVAALAAVAYAAVTIVVAGSAFMLSTAEWFPPLPLLALNAGAWALSVFLLTLWILVLSSHRDIPVAVLAYAVGTALGTAALWLLTSPPNRAEVVYVMIRPLTLGLITPPAGGDVTPSLGGFEFGIGIPWALFLILASALYWNRRLCGGQA